MKRTKIFYWIFTILFGGLMIFTSIPDILQSKEAVDFISKLGYPNYFIPFIGVAKLLGSIVILTPGYPRLKEWAYAGLAYDLIAAVYSQIAIAGIQPEMSFMILPISLGVLSYLYYHRLQKSKTL